MRFLALVLALFVGVASSQDTPQPKRERTVTQRAEDKRGTENAPLVIKGDITTKTAEKTEEDRHAEIEKADTDAWIMRFTGLAALFTMLLVVVTGVLAWFTYGLWSATVALARDAKATSDRQARDVQESLTVSRQSADAAKAAAEAAQAQAQLADNDLRRSHRPWIAVTSLKTCGPLVFDDHGFRACVDITVKNGGSSPAIGTTILTEIKISEFPGNPLEQVMQIHPQTAMNLSSITGALLLPNAETTWDQREIQTVLNVNYVPRADGLSVWLGGFVAYRDEFNLPHATSFLFRWVTPEKGAIKDKGDILGAFQDAGVGSDAR